MRFSHDRVNDLNLLGSLALLLETGSVTMAAKRAGVTQSAMSRTLSRLREALGDPLFVRTRAGMQPTAVALALAEPTRRALESARAVFEQRPQFAPASARRDFAVAGTDFASLMIVPPLVRRLRDEAPHVGVVSVPLPAAPAEALEAGTLDLAIAFGTQTHAGLRWQLLFEDELVCVARKDHPAFANRLTLARYLEHSHLSVTPAARAVDATDRVLARSGKQRRVVVRTTHFLIAPTLLREQSLILTTGARVATALAHLTPLAIVAAPVDAGPLRIGQLWHERWDRDPAHAWFRALVREVTK